MIKTNKQRKILCMILCLILACSCVPLGIAFASEQKPKEVAFGDITASSDWGIYGSDIRNISPHASSGKSISYPMSNPTDSNWVVTKKLDTPVNPLTVISEVNLGFSFWFHVGNPASLKAIKQSTGTSIELHSSGKTDDDNKFMAANFLGDIKDSFVVGWNEIVVKFSQMEKVGNPNISAINHSRLYFLGAGDLANIGAIRYGLNGVRFVETTQTEKVKIARTEKVSVTDSAELISTSNKAGWYGSSEISTNIPEGSSGNSIIATVGHTIVDYNFPTPFDATTLDFVKANEIGHTSAAALSFWWYIKDSKKLMDTLGDGQVELRSSGSGSETEEISIALKSITRYLSDGWNKVYMRLTQPLVPTKINYFRLYAVGDSSGTQQFAFHDIKIGKSNMMSEFLVLDGELNDIPIPDTSISIKASTGDAVTDWSGIEGTQDEQFEGTGKSLVANASTVEFIPQTAVDISSIENKDAYYITMSFDLYTNNAELLNNATPLSLKVSKTSAETNYFEFNMSNLTFIRGWNRVQVRLVKSAMVGNVDYSQIGYFKFTLPTQAASDKIALDEIRFYETGESVVAKIIKQKIEEINEPVDPDAKATLGTTSNLKGWQGGHVKGIFNNSPVEGGKSVFIQSNHGIQAEYVFTDTDITKSINTKHAVLTFWMYVSDASYLTTNGQIELGSGSGVDDNNEFTWSFTRLANQIESGKWNKISLQIIVAGKEGTNQNGSVDLTSLSYFRMYNLSDSPYDGGSYNLNVLISDLKIQEDDTSTYENIEKVTEKLAYTGDAPTIETMEPPVLDNGVSADNSTAEGVHPDKIVNEDLPEARINIGNIIGIVLICVGGASVVCVGLLFILKIKKKKS